MGACRFRKVLGVEINSILVEAAQENIKMNGVSPPPTHTHMPPY